jgi:RimJ/RimL family protein N-acetyltransferase
MRVQFVNDPSPVWDEIRSYLMDDGGMLVSEGPFIAVFDGEKMAGAFYVRPWSAFCMELHGGVHPDYWGRGVEVCSIAGRFLFTYTPCLKIVAIIPEYNKLMRRCVQKAGMKEEGRIKKAFLKYFKLHDLIVYGASKRDIFSEQRPIISGVS